MKEELKKKVRRALLLQQKISNINKQIHALEKERKPLADELGKIMENPYIYDKVEGLKHGGII